MLLKSDNEIGTYFPVTYCKASLVTRLVLLR